MRTLKPLENIFPFLGTSPGRGAAGAIGAGLHKEDKRALSFGEMGATRLAGLYRHSSLPIRNGVFRS